jgi:muramoyltetrapeptide carboxypeptidase
MLPSLLKKGDKIGIVAFAKKISLEEIQPAINVFKEWGLEVVVGETIGLEWHQFGGNDEQRRADIQKMLDDDSIKALISARGGYGCVRLIDKIDFSNFILNPKWLIGFSDITVFHAHIAQNIQIPTLHATMPIFFNKNSSESLLSLKNVLFEGQMQYKEKSNLPDLCKNGVCEGEIIGGNLSILFSLCGSISSIETHGKILFLEDLCEYIYHTDRMLQNLKRNGYFSNILGLIIGSFTNMKDNPIPFGKSTEEIIFNFCESLNIPIFTGFPAGHISDNKALILGEKVIMKVSEGKIKLVL